MRSKTAAPSRERRRKVSRRAVTSALATVALAVGAAVVPALPAAAYTTTGCKWNSANLNIDYRYVNGNFRSGIQQAASNYTYSTDTNLTLVDSSGPTFTAQNNNYGATGYEAQATWNCVGGWTYSGQARVNQYYLNGTEPLTRLKVVWAHELGHMLGLGHVSGTNRVMYTSASTAYNNGVTGLTSDEINGINALY